MRSLLRNQQPVFYKLYEGQEEIVDEWGNPTGSYVPIYSELKSTMLCVSPNKGNSEVEQFGSLEVTTGRLPLPTRIAPSMRTPCCGWTGRYRWPV